MKWPWILVIVVAVKGVCSAQKAPKFPAKIRGTYVGTQSEYAFRHQGTDFRFSEISMSISIEKYRVSLCFPQENHCPIENSAEIQWVKKKLNGKRVLAITVSEPGSLLKEEWLLEPQKKKILRKGILPQPDTMLTKLGKKQRKGSSFTKSTFDQN